MSSVKYKRAYECVTGCAAPGSCRPEGHVLTLTFHHTSDTVSVMIDGELRFVLDDAAFDALIDAYAEHHDRG